MIRDPKQRVISDWYDSYDDDEFDSAEDWMPLEDFADRTRGLAVRMLTRETEDDFDDECCSADEVSEAIRRLSTFAFVGLTDRWQLSVCLFHAMYGGDVTASEFRNVRHGDGGSSHHGYNTTMLGSFVDDADEALHLRAVEIFECNLQMYQVTQESCDAVQQQASDRWSVSDTMPTTAVQVEGACMPWCTHPEYNSREGRIKCLWRDCRNCEAWKRCPPLPPPAPPLP